MKTYHITKDGTPMGAFPEQEVQSMLASGTLRPTDHGWSEGMPDWRPLHEIMPRPANVPPPPPPAAPPALQPEVRRPKLGDDAGIRMLIPVGRSGLAIAAGYLGLFGLVIVPAPLALLVSILAIMDIQKSKSTPDPKRGMGRAVFGLVVGVAGTLILVLILLNSMRG